MKSILVTGVAGFIGFHLVNELLKRGLNVVGIDNFNDYYDPKLKEDRVLVHGIDVKKLKSSTLIQSEKYNNYLFAKVNLEDQVAVNQVFETGKFSVVVNLAAQAGVRYSLSNSDSYVSSNLVGFFSILECSRHFEIEHLVYASSSSVYGLSKKDVLKETDVVDNPISLYAATKKSNELMAHTYSHLFSLRTTGLRFFTVYGPWGRPDMAMSLFTKSILEGNPINVFNNGLLTRDFTYIP